MTNEEAIKHLKWFSEYNEDEYCGGDRIQKGADWYYYINEEDFEAFDVAIKALEQEPCEDCISREQAIRIAEQGQLLGYEWQFKELCKLSSIQPKPKYVAVGNVNFDKAELQKIVNEAIPTIMPEIEYRKAHWQNNACSNCGIYNASAYKNWCPNCGCQMTEETE